MFSFNLHIKTFFGNINFVAVWKGVPHMKTITKSAKQDIYKVTRFFYYSSIFWLMIGMTYGLIMGLKFIWPDFLHIGPLAKYLQYGRIRPIHTNIVLFGWLSMAYLGAFFYIIPKLCRTKLAFPRVAYLTGIMWNIFMLAGVVTLSLGYTTTAEYGELPFYLDVYLVILVALTLISCFTTIFRRQEKQLYVTLWYFMASLLWLPLLYIVGNFMYLFVSGVQQMNLSWFYGHNVIGLWFTTGGVGIIYYLLPYLAKNPLYSHKLSLIGFWTIAAFYVWNGPHHLQNGPIPGWLMKAGIIPSVLLIIPVWSVIANFFGTMKGKWHRVAENKPLKFLLTGVIFYFITCIQGPFQSLMGPSAILHFTDWIVGHAHLPLFGAFSLVIFALIYYSIPTLYARHVYSQNLVEWHYWLSVTGLLLFAFSTWTAGLFEGLSWVEGKQYGVQFSEMLIAMQPYFIIRAIGGLSMVLGSFLFAFNVMMSRFRGVPVDIVPISKTKDKTESI